MDVLMEITITFGANGFFFLEAEDGGTLLTDPFFFSYNFFFIRDKFIRESL